MEYSLELSCKYILDAIAKYPGPTRRLKEYPVGDLVVSDAKKMSLLRPQYCDTFGVADHNRTVRLEASTLALCLLWLNFPTSISKHRLDNATVKIPCTNPSVQHRFDRLPGTP